MPVLAAVYDAAVETVAFELVYRLVWARIDPSGLESLSAMLEWDPRWVEQVKDWAIHLVNEDERGPGWYRRRDGLEKPLSDDHAASDWSPEEALILLETLEESKLSERLKVAVVAIFEGYDKPERLAEALGVTRNNADQILHRLRKKLAHLL